MRKHGMVLACVAAAAIAVIPAMAAPKQGGGEKAKAGKDKVQTKAAHAAPGLPTVIPAVTIPLEDWQSAMTKELKLPAEQQAKLTAKIQAAIAGVSSWDQENASKVSAAQGELDKARAASKPDAIAVANQKIKDLQAARDKLIAGKQEEILASLTPEQMNVWSGYKLYNGLLVAFSYITLTQDQQDKMRTLCNEGAAEIAKAGSDAAKADAQSRLLGAAIALLTDQQRQALAGKADKAGKVGKSGGKTGAKGGKSGGRAK